MVGTAPFVQRPDDSCGLALNWMELADQVATTAAHHEAAIELFYKLQVNDWLALKPDLMWVPDPADGTGRSAWVLTLRTIVTL